MQKCRVRKAFYPYTGTATRATCNGHSCRLPQLDRISFGVMQACETAVGIRQRVNLYRDPCGLQLGGHSVEIADSKVHHPDFFRVSEIAALLRERTESGGPCFLLPGGLPVARRYERDPEVLLVPKSQCCRIVSSEEQSSDSRYFFHLPCSGGRRRRWLLGSGCGKAEWVPAHDEARPGKRQGSKQLASLKTHPIPFPGEARLDLFTHVTIFP
jgi:hypothetical protein